MSVVDQNIMLKLGNNASCVPMKTSFSNVGDVDDQAFEELINLALQMGLPLLEKMLLKDGYAIPQIGSLLRMANTSITQNNNVLRLASDVEFGPFPAAPTVSPTAVPPTTAQPTALPTEKPTVLPTSTPTPIPTKNPTLSPTENESGSGGDATEIPITRSPTNVRTRSSIPIVLGSTVGACALLAGLFSAFYMRKAKRPSSSSPYSAKIEEEEESRISVSTDTMMTANPLYGTSRPEPLKRCHVEADDLILPVGPFTGNARPKLKKEFPGDA